METLTKDDTKRIEHLIRMNKQVKDVNDAKTKERLQQFKQIKPRVDRMLDIADVLHEAALAIPEELTIRTNCHNARIIPKNPAFIEIDLGFIPIIGRQLGLRKFLYIYNTKDKHPEDNPFESEIVISEEMPHGICLKLPNAKELNIATKQAGKLCDRFDKWFSSLPTE